MPWTKGQSGNPNGRRKGTPNKALRESVEGLSIKAVNDLLMRFEELSNTDKVKVAQMALKYVLPQLKATEMTIDTNENVPSWVNAILNDEYKSE